jgi:ketosteroid isomerase-like protein
MLGKHAQHEGVEIAWNSKKESAMHTDNEKEIRALIESRVKAIRARNVNVSMENIGQDIVSFDVLGSLQYAGADAVRKRATEWFSGFRSPVGFEIQDLSIVVGEDIAFSHSLNHVNAMKIDGSEINMWWRSTACYRKTAGKWVVTHEHNSVPFDAASGRALLDLKP